MIINFIPEREQTGVQYLSQYKDGTNLAVLWKKFGTVHVNDSGGKIQNFTFKLLHMIDPDEFMMLSFQLNAIFPNYTITQKDTGVKMVIATPKEETDFIQSDMLQDKRTITQITPEQMNNMRGLPGFVI